MEKVMVRVTGTKEVLEVVREAFVEALEENGLDVIEKSLPRDYGKHSAVFLTALRPDLDSLDEDETPSSPPSLTPPPQAGEGKRKD